MTHRARILLLLFFCQPLFADEVALIIGFYDQRVIKVGDSEVYRSAINSIYPDMRVEIIEVPETFASELELYHQVYDRISSEDRLSIIVFRGHRYEGMNTNFENLGGISIGGRYGLHFSPALTDPVSVPPALRPLIGMSSPTLNVVFETCSLLCDPRKQRQRLLTLAKFSKSLGAENAYIFASTQDVSMIDALERLDSLQERMNQYDFWLTRGLIKVLDHVKKKVLLGNNNGLIISIQNGKTVGQSEFQLTPQSLSSALSSRFCANLFTQK
ncbi:MAG: hypothetical protein COT74_11830 [Bdellovibrionales bacterium CG10_big_fil_rev_8_21_14_0_10_45_34]|nr:MAG: hypothetical protein COT74_11830 [Bdellovibrionales bacterium CG10_big_fil_rev_8_21_14_0_10_45_34]